MANPLPARRKPRLRPSTEPVSTYHANGMIKSLTTFHKNGKPAKITLTNADGEEEGLQYTFYKDEGNLASVVPKHKGLANGLVKTFHPNGETQSECVFSNGKPIGVSTQYNTEGALTRRHYYVNGLRDGICSDYSNDGACLLRRVLYKQNQELVIETFYKSNGQADRIENYKFVPARHPNSIAARIQDGLTIAFYEHGGNTRSELNYKDGKFNGRCATYYERDGNTQAEGLWLNGKEDGVHTRYYENGDIEQQIPFDASRCDNTYGPYGENSNRHGVARYYYDRAIGGGANCLKQLITYDQGAVVGLQERYNADGTVFESYIATKEQNAIKRRLRAQLSNSDCVAIKYPNAEGGFTFLHRSKHTVGIDFLAHELSLLPLDIQVKAEAVFKKDCTKQPMPKQAARLAHRENSAPRIPFSINDAYSELGLLGKSDAQRDSITATYFNFAVKWIEKFDYVFNRKRPVANYQHNKTQATMKYRDLCKAVVALKDTDVKQTRIILARILWQAGYSAVFKTLNLHSIGLSVCDCQRLLRGHKIKCPF